MLTIFLGIINYSKEWGNILDVIGICDSHMQYQELHKKHINMDGAVTMHKLPKMEL